MPYKLSGVLKSPNGQPLTGVDIQFIAQQTQSPVLQQTDHNIRLGLDGAYNVTLENNTYAVKAQINGLGPQHMGYILISSDTPAGLDLPQLLRSYSQQSTAPDYAQLIEKWLAEAKAAADTSTAQAASAKSQADRAKSEADRASQISGLDTVADAIGLAAVPFPDVWIPFNDSLRMFAGYGREVKVGDDVVARMVNFERSTTATYIDKLGVLRTAAINEPRFEKQGLLIEGQSTNLIANSSNVGSNYNSNLTITSNSDGTKTVSNNANSQNTSGSAARRMLIIQAQVEPNTTYTFSALCSGKHLLSAYGSGVGEVKNAVGGSDFGLGFASITFTSSSAGGALSVEFYGGTTSNQLDFTPFIFVGYQLETLPFTSSYIPTNGAAVTRGPGKCWIPSSGNRFVDGSNFTAAICWDLLGVSGRISDNRLIDFDNDSSSNRHYIGVDQSSRLVAMFGSNKITSTFKALSGISVIVVEGNTFSLYHDGVKIGTASVTGVASSSTGKIQILSNNTGTYPSFGHVRNLRIWHSALSDAQIKGLK